MDILKVKFEISRDKKGTSLLFRKVRALLTNLTYALGVRSKKYVRGLRLEVGGALMLEDRFAIG